MGRSRHSNSILCGCSLNISFPHIFFFLAASLFGILFCSHHSLADSSLSTSLPNSFTVSSFSYPETKVRPYEWRYIRVDVPPWFSSMSMELESDVDLDVGRVAKISKSTLPLICLRDGSLPLPDLNDFFNNLVIEPLSNGSIGDARGIQNGEHCYAMQKRMVFRLTNEQITPGAWYFGLFNGIGAMRTQSKMINRGRAYTFSANVRVQGCTSPDLWGPYCNQTVESLSCAQSLTKTYSLNISSLANLYSQTEKSVISCQNSHEDSCLVDNGPRVHSMEIVGLAEELVILASDVSLNNTSNAGDVVLMCYARYGAMPSKMAHDYAGDINKSPLFILSPKIGRWYISILLENATATDGRSQKGNGKICYSLLWQVFECPIGKTGFNCSWERYTLQTVLRKNPFSPFESNYIPLSGKIPSDSANFPLVPLLSNGSASWESSLRYAWTYLTLEIPHGGAGGSMRVWLSTDEKLDYELYARFGGLPSNETWDYFFVSKTNNSGGLKFFSVNNSSALVVDFSILFIKEGTWNFAIKHLNSKSRGAEDEAIMSISLERCPNGCSSHGSCSNHIDGSGLTIYSYCSCDRRHGGFDCSVELVSHKGHVWQSIFLIASNAAAILPSYWSLRQKAFAEWVIYTSSGISSALYHACDVGTWCALKFQVLQFMDFWLSFMAVVSTFVYLAAIDESSRRTIHTVVSIVTALMAVSNATRSSNIVLVIVIGAAGLLVGLLIELSTKYRSLSLSSVGTFFTVLNRRQTVIDSLINFAKRFLKRFRWGFMLAGFMALTLAAVSWSLESSPTYWIWHSMWHVSIYTSSFLFLCSKATVMNTESRSENYELARQNSIPNGGA